MGVWFSKTVTIIIIIIIIIFQKFIGKWYPYLTFCWYVSMGLGGPFVFSAINPGSRALIWSVRRQLTRKSGYWINVENCKRQPFESRKPASWLTALGKRGQASRPLLVYLTIYLLTSKKAETNSTSPLQNIPQGEDTPYNLRSYWLWSRRRNIPESHKVIENVYFPIPAKASQSFSTQE